MTQYEERPRIDRIAEKILGVIGFIIGGGCQHWWWNIDNLGYLEAFYKEGLGGDVVDFSKLSLGELSGLGSVFR